MRRRRGHCSSFHLGGVAWRVAKRASEARLFFTLAFVLQQTNDDNRRVGAACERAASRTFFGEWVRVHFGDYQHAFLVGGTLGLIAACLALTIDRRSVEKSEVRVATELVGA